MAFRALLVWHASAKPDRLLGAALRHRTGGTCNYVANVVTVPHLRGPGRVGHALFRYLNISEAFT